MRLELQIPGIPVAPNHSSLPTVCIVYETYYYDTYRLCIEISFNFGGRFSGATQKGPSVVRLFADKFA